MKVSGTWALVTGGAKRLGRGMALGLANAGANVVIHHGHSAREAEQTVDEVRGYGVESFAEAADLTKPDAIDLLFSRIRDRCGRLEILVNSAASFKRQPLRETTVDEFDGVMDLNLRAPWLCLRKAAEMMLSGSTEGQERGVVVNIADLTGVLAWKGYSHHGVSKAGLVHLTRIAARELAPGIRVNCVVPGAILPPPGMSENDSLWRAKSAGIPLGRAGDPAAVADTVLFLVRNHFVTGSVLLVDGGEHLLGGNPAEPLPEGEPT